MRRWIWLPIGLMAAAVIVSMARVRPPTFGDKILAAMEKSSRTTRSAILLLDYSPDETAITKTMRETLERGAGLPSGFGLDSLDTTRKQWIKTSDALFFWSSPQGPIPVRDSLEIAHQQLIILFARGPFDDAETDAAFKVAFSQFNALSDESLFLAWANADQGVLSALDDRSSALRQAASPSQSSQ